MKIIFRGALILAAAAIAAWFWTILFPSPQKIIRHRLDEIARDASFDANESPLAALGKAQKLAGFVATNVEVNLDVPGHFEHTFTSRAEILQAVAGARSATSNLKIEFLDANVTVAPDKKSAAADLTLEAHTAGEKDFMPQQMKFTFQKIGGDWLITRVETVRTFS